MKVSNLLLGLVTLCCAVGSAVAAKIFVPQATWISGTNTVGLPTCSTLGAYCDPATGNTKNCEVRVILANGTTKSTRGKNTNVCTVPHRTGQVTIVVLSKPNLQDVETY